MSVLVRNYQGSTQAKASEAFARDAAALGEQGYQPVSQSWAGGGRTGAASFFVVLGVLGLVAGFVFPPLWLVAVLFLIIGLVSGKGKGTLTVTYQLSQQPVGMTYSW